MELQEQLLDTWRIHNRINLYLLNSLEESSLVFTSASKGRSAGEHFAHIHNVRLMWLKASAPELMSGLEKIEKGSINKKMLSSHLNASGEAIENMLKKGLSEGKIKGFKPHPSAFLGYLISHESHHRGQIALIMRENGKALDKKISYGMWEWGTR